MTTREGGRGGPRSGGGDDGPRGLGLRFRLRPPGMPLGVVAAFTPRPAHCGAPGVLHGGVAATCLDEAMAAVGWAVDGVHCVTATLELRYRRPVPVDGRSLTVEAWRERPESRRRQRVQGRLVLADGTVAVEASGIFVQVPRGPETPAR